MKIRITAIRDVDVPGQKADKTTESLVEFYATRLREWSDDWSIFGEIVRPGYPAGYVEVAKERDRLRAALEDARDVCTRKIAHANNGSCPDAIEGYDKRDEDCPACRAIALIDAAIGAKA